MKKQWISFALVLLLAFSLSGCELWYSVFDDPEVFHKELLTHVLNVFADTSNGSFYSIDEASGTFSYLFGGAFETGEFSCEWSGDGELRQDFAYYRASPSLRLTGVFWADVDVTDTVDALWEVESLFYMLDGDNPGHVLINMRLSGDIVNGRLADDATFTGDISGWDASNWGLEALVIENFNLLLSLREAAIAEAIGP